MADRWLQLSWTILFVMTGLVVINSFGWNLLVILDWLKLIPRDLRSPLIGAGATLVAALFGAFVVAWQIGRQAKIAISQTRETEQVKLKLKIYEDTIGVVEDAINSSVQFTALLRGLKDEIEIAVHQHNNGFAEVLPTIRFPRIIQTNAAHSAAYINIISTVERWQIIDPRILIFRIAISQSLSVIRAKQDANFNSLIMISLPTENVAGAKFPYVVPDEASLTLIKKLCNELIEALNDIQSYANDFQIEMQNLLLSDLFENRLPARRPLDPTLIAISLDRYDELHNHFMTQTEWGKAQQTLEADIRAQFADKPGL